MLNLQLIRANKIRIKLTKIRILLKQAKGLAEKERDMVLDRILLVLNQTLQYQDNLINRLIEQQKLQEKEDPRNFTIRAPKLKPKKAHQNNIPSQNLNSQIFSENPFEDEDLLESDLEVQEPPEILSMDMFSENPFQNILNQAQDLLDENLESDEDESDEYNQDDLAKKRDLLLDQIYRAKALLELTKMETEITISKKEYICIVHKGSIEGGAYICPHCKAMYCFKCANALNQQGETCWACQYDYKIDLLY